MKISILIITKNRPSSLISCLKSLLPFTQKIKKTIIIDSSRSLNQRLLKNSMYKSLHITYKYYPDASIPMARNIAVRLAKTTYILCIDDDCVLTTKINEMEEFKKLDADMIIGSITNGLLKNPYAATQQYYYDVWLKKNIKISSQNQILNNSHIFGFDIVFAKRHIFLKFPFEEILPFGNSEDIVLGHTLANHRINILYHKNLHAIHKPRYSLLPLLVRAYQNGYSSAHLKKIYDIDDRKGLYHVSFQERYLIFQKNKSPLSIWGKIIFIFLLGLHPFISLVGKSFYSIKHLIFKIA